MQVFVDAGILASLFFVAASGYATTLHWDTNGSAPGSGNAGGDYSSPGEIAIIVVRGTLISQF